MQYSVKCRPSSQIQLNIKNASDHRVQNYSRAEVLIKDFCFVIQKVKTRSILKVILENYYKYLNICANDNYYDN